MIMNIGIVAGDIWNYLDKHGKTKISKIVEGLEKDRDLIFMSLGWLAREGHVIVEGTDDYEISLRKKEEPKQDFQ